MKHQTSPWRASAVMVAGLLLFTACASDEGAEPEADDETIGAQEDTISIGTIPGWPDHAGVAHLYEHVLEENGYDAEVRDTVDVAPAYDALAEGELDVYGTAWPERTQKDYWEEHQDNLEDLGAVYDDARLFLAVPEYSEITSIEELPDHADELNGQITGIESGAGLSVIIEEEVIPHYGLDDDFELQLSSASGMVGELDEAIDNEEEIVVTLWTPYWATEQYDVRALEDPDEVYGEPESVRTLARAGFSDEYPEIARMIENFSLTTEQIADLQDTIVNEVEDDVPAAVDAWLEENPEVLDMMSADLTDEQ